jgi:myosin-15
MFLFLGSILVAVNPYRMFDIYGLDTVSRYEGRILGTLPPHLFAMGATAYNRLLAKDGQNQVRNTKSKQFLSFFLSFILAVTKGTLL